MACEAGGAKQKLITLSPNGNGSSVSIDVPRGFGFWHLHFPENMLLEGPGRGKAAMTWRTEKDGTTVLNGKMDGQFAHSIQITYKPGNKIIDIGLEVVNLSQEKWIYGGEAMACLRPIKSQDFLGSEGRRTFVYFQGQLQSVAALAQRFGRGVDTKTTVSLMVKGEQMAPYQAERHDARMKLDDGIILRQSPDKRRIAAFAWDRVHRVSMNFTYSCMHSNPRITGLASGEKGIHHGKIYFLECMMKDFWKQHRQDFGRKY